MSVDEYKKKILTRSRNYAEVARMLSSETKITITDACILVAAAVQADAQYLIVDAVEKNNGTHP